MKLLRYGPVGQEKPGLLDAEGRIRDLSGAVPDIAGDALTPAGIARLKGLDPSSLPVVSGNPRLGACVAGTGKFICIGLNYSDHAAETGATVPPEPIIFMKATSAIVGPNDDVEIPRASEKTDWEVELGVVIGKPAKYVSRGRRDEPCRRLLRHQRRLRARLPDRAPRPVDQGQELRHLRPDRPLAGDAGRGRRLRQPAHVAGGRRPPLSERLDQDDGLQGAVPGQLSQRSSWACSPATSSPPAPRRASAWARSRRSTSRPARPSASASRSLGEQAQKTIQA